MTEKLVASAMVLATGALATARYADDAPHDLGGSFVRTGDQDAGLGTGGRRLARPVNRGDHALGPEDAPVTLVMYGDYMCPRTRQAWPVVEELLEELKDQLRLVFRHFPATGDPPDRRAAEVAEAASAQGRFWEMHGALFQASKVIEGPLLARYAAAKVGLDRRKLERRVHAGKVLEDVEGGLESGVRQTPAFFVNGLRHDETYVLRVLLAATRESATG